MEQGADGYFVRLRTGLQRRDLCVVKTLLRECRVLCSKAWRNQNPYNVEASQAFRKVYDILRDGSSD